MRCKFKDCNNKIPKLMKSLYLCKCNKHYCNIHKTDHDCPVNFLDNNKRCLENKLVKVENPKLIKC